MEPTQAAPAGFILGGGGGVGAGSVGKGTGHFNMQGRTASMPGPDCPVGLLPLPDQLGGKPGEERKQPWESRCLLAWAL